MGFPECHPIHHDELDPNSHCLLLQFLHQGTKKHETQAGLTCLTCHLFETGQVGPSELLHKQPGQNNAGKTTTNDQAPTRQTEVRRARSTRLRPAATMRSRRVADPYTNQIFVRRPRSLRRGSRRVRLQKGSQSFSSLVSARGRVGGKGSINRVSESLGPPLYPPPGKRIWRDTSSKNQLSDGLRE